eukprot:jgi/Mesvir1/19766/Mv13066-RA.1
MAGQGQTPLTLEEQQALRVFMSRAESVERDSDVLWILMCSFLIFFMQGGFAMLSIGAVRAKNVKNILLYVLLDATFGALGWYVFGYAFAYGDDMRHDEDGNWINDGNGFIGSRYFGLRGLPMERFYLFFWQFTFAATASTIVSGSIIERTQIKAYICYSSFLTAFLYPVVAHWVWSGSGWLSCFKTTTGGLLIDSGMIDYAGCGVVHMVGGISGIVGAKMVGPRVGRFDVNGKPMEIPGHSIPFAALGVFMLWFGWYGFNSGSTGSIVGMSDVAAKVAVNTTLAGAAGGVIALFHAVWKDKVWDLSGAMNGALCGLVSITAACATVEPWAALILGGIGAILFYYFDKVLLRWQVDDPLQAGAMHGGCGFWGLIGTGILSNKENIVKAFPASPMKYEGLFYGDGGLFACQVIGAFAILAWILVNITPCFYILKRLGWLRVPLDDELQGLDQSKHGGSAYPEENPIQLMPLLLKESIAANVAVPAGKEALQFQNYADFREYQSGLEAMRMDVNGAKAGKEIGAAGKETGSGGGAAEEGAGGKGGVEAKVGVQEGEVRERTVLTAYPLHHTPTRTPRHSALEKKGAEGQGEEGKLAEGRADEGMVAGGTVAGGRDVRAARSPKGRNSEL